LIPLIRFLSVLAAERYRAAAVSFEPVIPLDQTFDALYGLEVLEAGDERVRARVPVRDELKQAMGLVHGGVFASIAESITSLATALAVIPEGRMAQGLSNQTSFLRPITEGTIHAEARRRHRGRTTWVWEVEITDDHGRLCALVRMTIAVRDAAPGEAAAGDATPAA
jgi:1,4-dihydroxy-2-naphthoyl-CoA hydrolase